MEKLSDYIPLFIIIASVILSFFRGTGKKEKKITGKTLLPKGIGREDEPIETKKENNIRIQQQIQIEKANEKRLEKTRKQQTAQISVEEFMEPVAEQGTPFLDVSNSEELKRAVIYSEILQKKEY